MTDEERDTAIRDVACNAVEMIQVGMKEHGLKRADIFQVLGMMLTSSLIVFVAKENRNMALAAFHGLVSLDVANNDDFTPPSTH